MNKYGIICSNEKYIYKEYHYDKLQDAINFEKKQSQQGKSTWIVKSVARFQYNALKTRLFATLNVYCTQDSKRLVGYFKIMIVHMYI